MEKSYHVYILASARNGTLYTGVTGDIARRIWEHRNGAVESFTKRYAVHRLVHVETFSDIITAIAREKAIKKWQRAWKLELIERDNPDWRDLFDDRSEEHTSELQSLMRISYAVFCLKKKKLHHKLNIDKNVSS